MTERISTLKKTREILDEYGLKARKKYGQNFLVSSETVDRIVSLQPRGGLILEIGPGLGSVTQQLLAVTDKLVAYDIDPDMCRVINDLLPQADVRNQDFLQADLSEFADKECCLVSNLPYYITTDILMKVYKELKCCRKITVMVQKEVAVRFLSSEERRDYNPLKVISGYYSDASMVCNVPRNLFYPAPNVDSAVICLTRNERETEPEFIDFVEKCFTNRRKKLLSNLKAAGFSVSEEVMKECGIDPQSRVEQLSGDDLHHLYRRLKS